MQTAAHVSSRHHVCDATNDPPGSLAVPGLDSLDGILECFFQNTFADGPHHETEKSAPKVFAVAHDHDVNVGCAVRMTGEGVGVARCASPKIGVSCRKDDAVGIGP